MAEKVVDVKEAAEILGYAEKSYTLITRWCKQGRFQTARKLGRSWVIDRAEIESIRVDPVDHSGE